MSPINHLEIFQKLYQYTFPTEVAAELKKRTFQRDEYILKAGEEIDGLYFLIEGSYYVSTMEITGKELLLRFSTKPAILGDIELVEQCPIQSNCVATDVCEFIFVPVSTYKKYLEQDANFIQLLLKELAYKLKTCTISSRVNALSPVSVRLAAYYCTIASAHSNSEYITAKTLDEVASFIGTTKRHVNRILKRWSEEGIIQRDGDDVKVLNWNKMRFYSNGVRFE